MLYLFIKATVSGVLVAIISEVARRYPGFGGLIASLPLVSVLGMIWLWRDRPGCGKYGRARRGDILVRAAIAADVSGHPAMLRHGYGFWVSLVAGCLVTVALYSMMIWAGPRVGLRL